MYSQDPPLFPHETIRPIQQEYSEDVQQALEQGKTLVAHAPTGLGKTAAVLAPALHYANENDKVVFFLTNRHTQHKIAVDTLKKIREKHNITFQCADLIGKKWMCNQTVEGLYSSEFNDYCKAVVENKECEYYNNFKEKNKLTPQAKRVLKQLRDEGALHNEELIHRCRSENLCCYETAMKLAEKSRVVIADYHYLFNPFIQNKILSRLNRDLQDVIIIVDEGHNLPQRVMDLMSNKLTTYSITNAINEAKKNGYFTISKHLEQLQDVLNRIGDGDEQEKSVGRQTFISKISNFIDYDEFVDELLDINDEIIKRKKKSFIGGVASFLEQWPHEQGGLIRFVSRKQGKYGPVNVLHYSCLDPSIITKDIFNECHSAIIMSGTLRPPSMYKDLLGIENGTEREYESPFPPDNKLSLIIPETTTKYTLRNETMYKKIAEKCSELTSLIPGNVALFFPSYDLRDRICNFFESTKKKFREKSDMSKEEKEEFLDEFRAENEHGGVLLGVTGANFAEGIDLPGNLLNGVIIIGLPLGKPDLKTREIIKYYEEKFGQGWNYGYQFPAITKCIQSAGRCIRSETDKGAVIFLDERFSWQNYFRCLPKEGLIVSREYEKLLKEFWG